MDKKLTAVVLLALFSCVSTPAISAGQPGTTDTVFNKKFIGKLTSMMPYGQLVKIIGTDGEIVGEEQRSSAPKMMYHWNGGRNSAFEAKVAAGKVVDLTVVSPRKQKFTLGKSGELVDLGD